MNKNKRILLIAVIILNFLSAGLNIYFVVDAFIVGLSSGIAIFSIIFDIISIVGLIVSAGLLIYAISSGGQFFRQRNSYYIAALVITICLNFFSVASILLIISMFMSDLVWVKPHDDVYFEDNEQKDELKEEPSSEKERLRKIQKLRELKENGTITEEEFNQQLMRLL